jgi:pimeloyl-ACP methyl ester carboxylesterase
MGPDIPWVLSGHSRGAAISTRLVGRSPGEFDGLALVGTTHPRMDLSHLRIPVYKIGGTRDCVASRRQAESAASNLPADTEWRWIEGANHAQFGWYGAQLGDCRAEIGREAQQAELVDVLREALDAVARPARPR